MSVTVQTVPQQELPASIPKDVNEFFVPTILNFNLKKTTEDHLSGEETGNTTDRQNGAIVSEENEDVIEMSPRKKESNYKSKTSSFLLEPFLRPVDPFIESNKENPVLKALYGGHHSSGLSPWTYVTRTSINNCHPFKKTELSHDLVSDDTPIQIPKSLVKNTSKMRKASVCHKTAPSELTPKVSLQTQSETKACMYSDRSANCSSMYSSSENVTQTVPNSPVAKNFSDMLCIMNKRKRYSTQLPQQNLKSGIQYVNCDRLIQLRTHVDNAVKNHKVYSMTGTYNSVRRALKQRGWIEKIDSEFKGRRKINKFEEIGLYDAAFQFVQKNQTIAAMRLSVQTNSGFAHSDQIHYTGQGEAEIINRMLKNVTEDLCWLSRPYPYYVWKDFDKFDMINRLPRAYFSNKIGLCNSLQQIQWYYEAGVCSTQFPRTYNTSLKDELDAFKEDFRLTSCISLLKWFLQTYKSVGEKGVRSPDGKIEMNVIEFALRRCAEFVKTKQHEDIDVSEMPTVWEYQWDQFITQYYKIVNEGQILKDTRDSPSITIKAMVSNAQSMLNILKPHWPQFDIEGYQNFWIVKPGGRCCGSGIVIKNNLEQILGLVNGTSMRETRYVVQKYIERPLLIYNTKFDIRQWFLVTNVYPLTVWMYRESYLRFCSQPFTLKNTHESIHLCNNAVQKKYRNGKRDRGLPDENMWDCYTFQTYLKAIGHADAWEKYIYPGMKEGFIGALLTSQETMERKKNRFELYGADFMISDSLTDGPWLIEINSNPAMDSSTSVTARLCPQVLEDIIKVVIDRRDNKCASTGAFEMVYKQNCPPIPPYLGMSLCIKGKKAFRASGESRAISRKSKNKHSNEPLLCTDTEEESVGEETDSVRKSPKVVETPEKDASSSDEGNSGGISANVAQISEALSARGIKKERSNKRRRTDWVRKNIENVKSINSMKSCKNSTTSISDRSSPKRKAPSVTDSVHRDRLYQFLETMDTKLILKEIMDVKKTKGEMTEEKNTDKADPAAGGAEMSEKKSSDFQILKETKKSLLELPQTHKEDESIGKITTETNRRSGEVANGMLFRITSTSCPNFDVRFEKELLELEEKEKLKSEESCNSFFSALSFAPGNRTSVDYFRDWRSKVNETRKTCEDMLEKLQAFQEENSKVKFQDALKKRIKNEVDFIRSIRQHKRNKKSVWGESASTQKGFSPEKNRAENCRPRTWDGDGVLTPLAINAETGAVRNINDCLPKIKQRSRPLLPNGSSGHGRKIDVSLDQPTYYQ